MPEAPITIDKGPWEPVDGGVVAPIGFSATGTAAGLRSSSQRADMALVYCDRPATTAGTFTKNVLRAAPVQYCQQLLSTKHMFRAVLGNAASANAATGTAGLEDAQLCAQHMGKALELEPSDVLLLSTGLIGARLDVDSMVAAVPILASNLGQDPDDGIKAAVSITTTDLVYKSAALALDVDGQTVHVGGLCKGSGMIHPNMGTMLSIVTCDAPVKPSVWQAMVLDAVSNSFNMISVDGDTSTNDTVLALTSGAVGIPIIEDATSDSGRRLSSALTALLQGLAKSIAWDGEGATCLVEVQVTGAKDRCDAQTVAKSVASSTITKAALFGHDPNWGRIACSAGYSGVSFDPSRLDIHLGIHALMKNGQPLEFDKDAASAYMKDICEKRGTVIISVSIGDGSGCATAWGCDLSYEYVRINAEYTT